MTWVHHRRSTQLNEMRQRWPQREHDGAIGTSRWLSFPEFPFPPSYRWHCGIFVNISPTIRNKENILSHIPYKSGRGGEGKGTDHSALFLPLSFALSPFALPSLLPKPTLDDVQKCKCMNMKKEQYMSLYFSSLHTTAIFSLLWCGQLPMKLEKISENVIFHTWPKHGGKTCCVGFDSSVLKNYNHSMDGEI